MNKKIVTLIIFIVVLAICGGLYFALGSKKGEVNQEGEKSAKEILNNNSSEEKSSEENKDDNNNGKSNGKTLVAYFSMNGEVYNVGDVEVGNTAMVASYIKEYLNADSFEITPVNAYPTKHSELLKVATQEQNSNARPEIKKKIDNFDEYDTVFILFPIWWGDMPQIIYTFMESYDFNGKTVIPVNTHEGSGSSGTHSTIKSKLSSATVKDGIAIQGKVARTEEGKNKTIDFLKSLGY